MPEDAPFEPAAASAPRPASTEEEGPDATYDQFLLNLLIKGPPPKVKADDDDASSDDGEELDIDTLMLQDILAKAHLDIDACMLRDILATEDFADLVYGDKTKNAAGEVDLTPLLDVMSTEEWSQIIRDRMSPDTAPKDGAAEVAAIWAEILAGPKQAVAGEPPPSWFNTVCAWFSEPRLPDDMEAPGAVPTAEVRPAAGVGGADGGPRRGGGRRRRGHPGEEEGGRGGGDSGRGHGVGVLAEHRVRGATTPRAAARGRREEVPTGLETKTPVHTALQISPPSARREELAGNANMQPKEPHGSD